MNIINQISTQEFNTAAIETGISSSEIDQLHHLIKTTKDVWIEKLRGMEQPFLYLKRKELPSPYTIQVFKDGQVWIHTKQAMYGTAKKAKVIVEWETGKQYVKSSTLKHLRTGGRWTGGDRIGHERKICEKLKGKRGIVPLVDAFSYPSKSALDNKKNVLIRERWSNLEQLKKWTKEDIKVIALDLLYAVKAFKEAGLTDGDFNRGNVLVLRDKEGKATKAGLIDFEQTEELSKALEGGLHQSAALRRFFNPKTIEFDLQNEILLLIKLLYSENDIGHPEVCEILFEGYYQQGGNFLSGKVQEHIPTLTIDEIIEKMEKSS